MAELNILIHHVTWPVSENIPLKARNKTKGQREKIGGKQAPNNANAPQPSKKLCFRFHELAYFEPQKCIKVLFWRAKILEKLHKTLLSSAL